ncbi:MAG: methyltransferase [Eubacteriaceae bacterium]|nr:methyltransferase [Eubacteriaceae bacterium]
MTDRPISNKENLLRTIRHESPEWLPMRSDFVNFTPSIIPDNVARHYVLEAKPWEGPEDGLDAFGIKWKYIPSAGGSMVEPGNPFLTDIEDWKEKIVFPDVDSWDWEGSARDNAEFLRTDKIVITWIFTGMFERLISFMDFEAAAMALIDEDQQEYVHGLFQALTDYYKELISRFKKYYDVDALYFHDDWGSQNAPFFSLDTCMEMLVPYLKQIVECCHENDIIFEFHCCGKNEKLVPAMIECGMDIWGGQPLNDKRMLVKTYGDRILLGEHDPFFTKPYPDDEGTADRMVDEYLGFYTEGIDEKPMFIMNLKTTPAIVDKYYEYSHRMLGRA